MNSDVDSEPLYLDARQLRCPEPLMLVRNQIRSMPSQAVLHVQATDPTTERDLVNFCHFMGHEMIDMATATEGTHPLFEFWIRKG